MNTKLINLTSHSIVIYKEDGTQITIPPSGMTLRLNEHDILIGNIDGIPLIRRTYSINNLPPREEGTIYIVSSIALAFVPEDRIDIVAPDTGKGAVRDNLGKIIGTKAFLV